MYLETRDTATPVNLTEGILHKQYPGSFQAFVSDALRPQVSDLFSVAVG